MRKFFMSAAAVTALLAATPAYADRCSADAQNTGYHELSKNKYLFTFHVSSSECQKYPCVGYVHFGVVYHFAGGNDTSRDNTLINYMIPARNGGRDVSLEHYVATSGNSDVVIDNVEIKEVTCSSP